VRGPSDGSPMTEVATCGRGEILEKQMRLIVSEALLSRCPIARQARSELNNGRATIESIFFGMGRNHAKVPPYVSN